MAKKESKWTKDRVKKEVRNVLFILAGSAILALGSAMFIVPFNIVKGGMTSVAMMINKPIEAATGQSYTDILVWAFNIVLWVIGFFVLGKEFAMRTLIGSVAYPLALTLFLRFDIATRVGLVSFYENSDKIAALSLLGLAGGVVSGIGASLAFIGNGSTGGSDVISYSIAKYTDLKQDNAGLLVDSVIILAGLAVFQDWGQFLVGILAAFASSAAVKALYVRTTKNYRVQVISDNHEAIQDFLGKEFHKTCTLSTVVGGYSKQEKTKISVLLTYHEFKVFREVVGSFDPKAFVSADEVSEVAGGAFEPAHVNKKEAKRLEKLYGITLKQSGKGEPGRPAE
jgi:uncharacterized membrane-anchored protein YitT (DUF2179 family)